MRLGRVEVSGGFLLLLSWLVYWDTSGVVWQTFVACALHELGHLAALSWIGLPVRTVRINVFGAGMEVDGVLSYRQELLAAMAGPAVNLTLAYCCCRTPALRLFSGLNLALAAFNLLPVGELDGGRMLSSALHLLCPDREAERMRRGAELVCCLVFVLCALRVAADGGNVTLCLVCFWLLSRTVRKKDFGFAKKNEKGLAMRWGND